jgi:hypothetical protein
MTNFSDDLIKPATNYLNSLDAVLERLSSVHSFKKTSMPKDGISVFYGSLAQDFYEQVISGSPLIDGTYVNTILLKKYFLLKEGNKPFYNSLERVLGHFQQIIDVGSQLSNLYSNIFKLEEENKEIPENFVFEVLKSIKKEIKNYSLLGFEILLKDLIEKDIIKVPHYTSFSIISKDLEGKNFILRKSLNFSANTFYNTGLIFKEMEEKLDEYSLELAEKYKSMLFETAVYLSNVRDLNLEKIIPALRSFFEVYNESLYKELKDIFKNVNLDIKLLEMETNKNHSYNLKADFIFQF